ncbi:hypothetical protein [Algoriphagus sp. CAU 1675]|uniref:hypothetical protein n=1 Tax=Algoriphagus sp. CAU 1675 TaxID=3032597 RepID=UPI0023DAB16E|nr:hypothetical protein [Algoriphagus sp. CAU 1675]MDF2157481.1 hypothetical protein [Algoriphagus sp. CAU 1675]
MNPIPSSWFSTYEDQNALVNDGTQITNQYIADIHLIQPNLKFDVQVIINTTPALVFFDPATKTVNLPFWDQLSSDSVGFFNQMGGSPEEGKRLFGLFFNGFYLPHELGHGLQFFAKGDEKGSYKNEFFANQVGLSWWRKHLEDSDLNACYAFAQHIISILPDPVPKGMTIEQYFNENYDKVSSNPYIYGYMQFNQFIQIYEDKNLPDFDTLVSDYLKANGL